MNARVKSAQKEAVSDRVFADMDAVMLGWLYGLGFRKKRLMKFYVQYAMISDRYRARYGTDKDSNYTALERDMAAVGVSPLTECAETVRREALRWNAVQTLSRIDTITYCAARDAFGWGKKRLERLYEPLRLCHRIFLQTTTQKDEERIAECKRNIKSAGIDLAGLEEYSDKILKDRQQKDERDRRFEKVKQNALTKMLCGDKTKDWASVISRIDAGDRSEEILYM